MQRKFYSSVVTLISCYVRNYNNSDFVEKIGFCEFVCVGGVWRGSACVRANVWSKYHKYKGPNLFSPILKNFLYFVLHWKIWPISVPAEGQSVRYSHLT
jgi:hypothetical protein